MTPEVRDLLHKARESQHAAGLLQHEGYLDFAASRAYYAHSMQPKRSRWIEELMCWAEEFLTKAEAALGSGSIV